jgi:phosphatidate cytidylyltransferase
MSELARRVLFSVVAAPLAILIVLAGGAALAALLAIVSALAAWEFYRIASASGLTPMDDIGIALAGIVPLLVHARYLGIYETPLAVMAAGVLVLFALAIWRRGVEGRPLGAVASTVLGVIYTGGMLSFGYAIRYHPYAVGGLPLHIGGWQPTLSAGGVLLLLPLLLTWASDIGAYFVGRAFGKRKLIPRVSPGKTVAGAWGALGSAVIVAWLYAHFVLRPVAHLDLSLLGAVVFGVIVSVAAQIGDLVESLLKREAGMKDSSHLIPGHGGILDRFDSLLFVLPVSFLLFGWRLLVLVP